MNIIEIHAHNNGLSNVSGKLKIFLELPHYLLQSYLLHQ